MKKIKTFPILDPNPFPSRWKQIIKKIFHLKDHPKCLFIRRIETIGSFTVFIPAHICDLMLNYAGKPSQKCNRIHPFYFDKNKNAMLDADKLTEELNIFEKQPNEPSQFMQEYIQFFVENSLTER